MFMEKRKRGRPPGPTARGEATRERLYEAAITAFDARGYEATTLRHIAKVAGVSPGLLYRYFPSKSAVVVELYDRLSKSFTTFEGPQGPLATRFAATLRASLAVLAPHRDVLRSMLGVLLADPEVGLLSPHTEASRSRVRERFEVAVAQATDVPASVAEPLGRLAYWVQMGVILWWLLDRSAHTEATTTLIEWLSRGLAWLPSVRWVPGFAEGIRHLDALATQGLLGGGR
ncbi:MAG: TetR/AcrR family transcriptional regulator [Myxococcota bacterium]